MKQLLLTDTLPLSTAKQSEKIRVISLAPLLGETIHRIHTGQSVGELFL